MKVFEGNLAVGDEYYLGGSSGTVGVFVGHFNESSSFYKTSIDKGWNSCVEADGTINIPMSGFYYEEV